MDGWPVDVCVGRFVGKTVGSLVGEYELGGSVGNAVGSLVGDFRGYYFLRVVTRTTDFSTPSSQRGWEFGCRRDSGA